MRGAAPADLNLSPEVRQAAGAGSAGVGSTVSVGVQPVQGWLPQIPFMGGTGNRVCSAAESKPFTAVRVSSSHK